MNGDSSGTDAEKSALPEADPQALRIFICYRREDAAANAGRLADALVERFGRNSVFMDVDTIEPGVDFNEAIDRAIGHCDVLIALIGPHWLEAANVRGRRLDDPQDFVRLEIGNALDRKIRVIPTLVGGAEMPQADELPADMVNLAKRNAVELTDKRFRSDLQALIEPLERIAQQKRDSVLPTARIAPRGAGYVEPKAIAAQQASTALPASVTMLPQRSPAGGERITNPPPKRRNIMPLIAVLVAVALVVAGASALALNRLSTINAASKATNLLELPAGYAGTWRGTAHEFSPSTDFALVMTMRAGKLGSKVGTIDRPGLTCQQDLILGKASAQLITLTEQGYCNMAGTTIVASLSGASMGWKEFQTDPSAGNPIATASLGQASSGSIPGTSNLLALTDAYAGTWKGTAHEINPSTDFAIIVTIQTGQIGSKVGTINRPSLSCQQDLILEKATTQSITLTEQGYCNMAGTKIVASVSGASMDWKEFQTDPSSGNPIATAALGQASSGTIPGSSDLVAVPDGYAGTWKGTAHEINPSTDFAIIVTIQTGQVGSKVATINRPSLNCQQDLILDKATSQSITLTEQGYCNMAGTKIEASVSGTSMDWKEFQTDPSSGNPIATATLTKTA